MRFCHKQLYKQQGLTLIELMIAMLIGLVILGAVLTVLLSNSNTYRSNEAVGRIQESARFAFELMARDLREAGGLPCGPDLDVANVLNNSANTPGGSAWWADYNNGIRGYEGGAAMPAAVIGTNAGERVAGTDAIVLSGARGTQLAVSSHVPTSAVIHIAGASHNIEIFDILLICDFDQASIFQATPGGGSGNIINHNTGNVSVGPGNCTKGLGYSDPMDCSTNGTLHPYGPNSIVARFRSTAWFVGCNGRFDCGRPEGRSLFKSENGVTDEVVDLVTDMQLQYLDDAGAAYVDASAVADWSSIIAVQATLTLGRSQNINNPAAEPPITRAITHTVALRNRLP
jgi:type IV pilus assembly protein PilW